MRVAIIGTVGLPARYGGFETLAEHLTKHLGNKYSMRVFCSSKAYSKKQKQYNGARLTYLPLRANGVQSIMYDMVSIVSALRSADVLLVLGVSGCVILPLVKRISRKKVIVNIDGLEWKREKWGRAARWFLKYSEKLAVKFADTVVSDNRVIQAYVKEHYGVPSKLIAYGADHTDIRSFSKDTLKCYPFLAGQYAFKVCRIEPENNLHMILQAFAEHPALNLVVVGNWKNSEYGRKLKAQFGAMDNIYLLEAIYDQHVLNQIRSNCDLYVHGHSAGGTNPSLVEAMYLGLPVIAFGVNYNRETTANKALYFDSKDDLVRALKNNTVADLKKVGGEMKSIADREYSWEVITDQYATLF